jgi:hypothetical protein
LLGISQGPVPEDSLLRSFPDDTGDYFYATVDASVSQADYVYTFYTSRVFKLERRILAWVINKPSTDAEARALADGQRETFSAWTLGARHATQLLMGDFMGRTRSWLSVVPQSDARGARTLLRFGSGIAKRADRGDGERRLTLGFRLLGRFHILYSQILLRSAIKRLRRLGVC